MRDTNSRGLKNDPTERGTADRSRGRDTSDSRSSDDGKDIAGASTFPGDDSGRQNHQAVRHRAVTDGGHQITATVDDVDTADLSRFQLEICYLLAQGPDYGLGLKSDLEEYYGEDVNHGRLYPNLDRLAAHDLVEISQRDERTNEYALTDTGRELVRRDAQRRCVIAERMGGGD